MEMILPRFLIADNDSFPENAYVVHTEKPCFIIDVDSEEYKILDGSEMDEDDMQELIEEALGFYEDELERYEDGE